MIFRLGLIRVLAFLAMGLGYLEAVNSAWGASADSKIVRLRSGEIRTPARGLSVADLSNDAAGGLVLLQLESGNEPAWREQLAGLGVDLLAYVPDDAYVARLKGIRSGDVRALPFVRWVDRYRPEQKLHVRLWQNLGNLGRGQGGGVEVNVLVDPAAKVEDLGRLQGLFEGDRRESRCRLGGIWSGRVPPHRLFEAAMSPAVLWIEPPAQAKLTDESTSALVGGPITNHLTFTQALGYDGSGVIVAVTDSGLDRGVKTNHTELLGRTKALFYYGGLANAADEHAHGTHVAGIIAGSGITQEGDEFGFHGLGVAPGAQLVAQRIFDARGGFRPPPFLRILAEDALRSGAVIANNSWAEDTQGRYDLSAAQFDEFTRDGDTAAGGDQALLFVFSAGNAGPGSQTVGSPAVAKNVIAVGASQGPRTNFLTYSDGAAALANFSSRGPTEDGRIKPDLLAPGTWVASLLSRSGRVENAWAPINDEFAFMGGTSQSAPHVSGAAAVFVEYFRSNFNGATPSPALIKAALINAAADLNGLFLDGAVPNMEEGWGRADVAALIRPDRTFEFVDQDAPLAVGRFHERRVFVTATNYPLVVTLAYTDFPGFPAAIPALVNDLDLELVGPDGREYRGNQFDQGESIPGARSRDSLNNVEGIRLKRPLRGEYILRVRATNIAQDSRRDTGTVDQDFTLVISGGLPARSEGVILADRAFYRAPGRVLVTVVDADLAGQATIGVATRSRTETNGPALTLLASDSTGTFTGAVETAMGPVISFDQKLQIADGDFIRLSYFDASHQLQRIAMATADLIPPAIFGVGVTNMFGQRAVTWTTVELSTSVLRYGTTPGAMTQTVSNTALTTVHEVDFGALIPGFTYYYIVLSADAAGNVATNTDGGVPYTFTPAVSATVLLVDAYEADPRDTIIPLETYTTPLLEIGVTYDVWSVAERHALPELSALRPYPIVMWRINDSIYRPNDVIPLAQQMAIQAYVKAGGSFFFASMNAVTRLLNQGAGSFVTNVLQVRRFVLNPNSFSHCEDCDEDFRVPTARGVASDPIGRGLGFALDYSAYPMDGAMGPDFGDTFTPTTNATPFLLESVSGKPCGVRFPRTGDDSPGRVVFVTVPLDAIPISGASPNNRTDFLRRVVQFLSPGVGGVGTLALDQERYTMPDLITVEVADSDLAGEGFASVRVRADSSPASLMVNLGETARSGLFRGFIPVAPAAGQGPPGALRVIDGDGIHVEYFDASAGTPVESAAVIDATAPGINDISIKVGYFDALIRWTTTKPTDALIQFGESAFLGRTQYRSDRRTVHELRLIGLVPERAYFCKVVVRDEAGNITSDDNGSELYSFQTLAPLRPPFFDNVEGGVSPTNWTVLSSDDSQRAWSSGPPNDEHTVFAFSGANVWASNLYGESADVIDTYLISPGIDLRGMNVAELRFQHDYDFLDRTGFDVISGGRLLISTNVQTDLVPIAEYNGFIPNWEEQVVDLTPYAGRIVFLVWHHHLRSASPEAPILRPGWALDDIRITGTSVPGGTIRVTNNISQARFTVRRGVLSQAGQGNLTMFTNLPPGTYALNFENVMFYTAPAAQTNTLLPGAILSLSGTYTFADINTNGMSDAWETAKFGTVSLTRTNRTDTDGDGFTDYAEFVAGTDPLAPNSYLVLASPFPIGSSLVRFSWPSMAGRSYQLQASNGNSPWVPVTGWIRAVDDVETVIRPPPGPPGQSIYRLEVRP